MRALATALALILAPAVSAAVVTTLDNARYHIGDGQYTHTTDYHIVDSQMLTGTHLEIPFRLGGATAIAVRIQSLWGVGGLSGQSHSNWVLVDGVPVGRIIPGQRQAWSSSPVSLGAGLHRIRIVSEGPGDRDDFVLQGISVATVDRVSVESAGSSRIWSEAELGAPASSLGASRAEIDAFLRRRLENWEETQRAREMEENREALRMALLGEPQESDTAPPPTEPGGIDLARLLRATEPPPHSFSAGAFRIESAHLAQGETISEDETSLTVLIGCRFDEAFVTRGARPVLHWRWAGTDLGGGPVRLGNLDRPDPTLRFRVPILPPSPGRWTLEITVVVDQWGDSAELTVEVQ